MRTANVTRWGFHVWEGEEGYTSANRGHFRVIRQEYLPAVCATRFHLEIDDEVRRLERSEGMPIDPLRPGQFAQFGFDADGATLRIWRVGEGFVDIADFELAKWGGTLMRCPYYMVRPGQYAYESWAHEWPESMR